MILCCIIVNDLRVLRNLLDVVARKWYMIGIQLGIPKNKLDEFQNLDDPLSEVINYWLQGNVKGAPVSWETIVEVLRTEHVGEPGLATKIQSKYCIGIICVAILYSSVTMISCTCCPGTYYLPVHMHTYLPHDGHGLVGVARPNLN